jgi:hypothetical protein
MRLLFKLPEGMAPWAGGDSAPADWDGGAVLLRNGSVMFPSKVSLAYHANGTARWNHQRENRNPDWDIIAYTPTRPQRNWLGEVERHLSHETVCGFKVAAYRETHPEHGSKFGHSYCEHWSTPNNRDPRVTVERLFTEAQLREALFTRPQPAVLDEVGREAIARIVDPEAWSSSQSYVGTGDRWAASKLNSENTRLGMSRYYWKIAAEARAPSLAKADAILAHIASTTAAAVQAETERCAAIAEGFEPTGYMSDREREYCRQHGEEVAEAIRTRTPEAE